MIQILSSKKIIKLAGILCAAIYFFFIVGLYLKYNYISSPSDWIYLTLLILLAGVSFGLCVLLRKLNVLPDGAFLYKVRFGTCVFYSWLFLVFVSIALLALYSGKIESLNSIRLAVNSISIFLVYGAILGAWYISGRRIYQLLGLSIQNHLGSLLLTLIIGQIGSIVFFYFVTALGVLSNYTVFVYLFLCVLIGYTALPELFREIRTKIHVGWSFRTQTNTTLRTALLITLWIYSVVAFVIASTGRPLDPDVVKTYGYIPYAMLQSGSPVDFQYTVLNNSAFASSYLYMPFISFGPHYINYINIVYLWLIVGTIYYFTQKYSTKRAAIIACFLFLSMDFVFLFMTNAKTDFLLTFIVLWSVLILFRSLDSDNNRWLVLSGIFFGVAVAIKYNALFLAPGIFLFLVWYTGLRIQTLRSLIVFGLSALGAYIPWGIRGLLMYHNPVYPFTLFGSRTAGSLAARRMLAMATDEISSYTHLLKRSNPIVYNLYLLATNKTHYAFNKVGPLLFGLAPLFLTVRKIPSIIKRLALIIIPTLIAWYSMSVSQVWYMLYILPLVWIMIAILLDKVIWKPVTVIVSCVLVFLLISNLRIINLNNVQTLYAGSYSPDYIFSTTSTSVEQYINTSLGVSHPSYLILPFGDIDTFSIHESFKHVIDNDFFIYWIPLIADSDSPEAIRATLHSRGVTHVFVNEKILQSLEREECRRVPCPTVKNILKSIYEFIPYMNPVHTEERWTLYEI